MKQVIAGTLRSRAKRLALPLIGGLVALGLVGCSSQTAVDTAPVAQAQQAQPTKPIAFAPIIGAPSSVGKKFIEALTASAAQKSIPVVTSKEADYTIRGYLVAAADPKGTKLSYIWDITDKSSKRAKRFQGDELIEGKKGGDAWALVDEAAMQRVASKTTDELVTWLPKAGAPGAPVTASAAPAAPSAQPASVASEPASTNNAATAAMPTPKATATRAVREPKTTGTVLAAANTEQGAAAGPMVAVVPPVTGAPGDGVTSLTDAMKRQLQSEGVKLGEGSGPNAYIVRGSVQLEKAVDGQQPITIRWLVYGPDGKQMEKAVVQRNKVPEGSLDGSWGQVADLAAGEAARSIAKLINKPAS